MNSDSSVSDCAISYVSRTPSWTFFLDTSFRHLAAPVNSGLYLVQVTATERPSNYKSFHKWVRVQKRRPSAFRPATSSTPCISHPRPSTSRRCVSHNDIFYMFRSHNAASETSCADCGGALSQPFCNRFHSISGMFTHGAHDFD